jgi:hypothetical protein
VVGVVANAHLAFVTNALRQMDMDVLSKGKKEEDFSANASKKIHWKNIPFSTALFASVRFCPWQICRIARAADRRQNKMIRPLPNLPNPIIHVGD